MRLKTVAAWAICAFAVWWVIQNPTSAANLAGSIAGGISHAANSASTILNRITSHFH